MAFLRVLIVELAVFTRGWLARLNLFEAMSLDVVCMVCPRGTEPAATRNMQTPRKESKTRPTPQFFSDVTAANHTPCLVLGIAVKAAGTATSRCPREWSKIKRKRNERRTGRRGEDGWSDLCDT